MSQLNDMKLRIEEKIKADGLDAALAIGIFLVLTLLTRLVFRRLEHIIVVATRVVGEDYESEIQVTSDDEVGQFEQLFEQFRRVFVDIMAHVPELQEKG